MKKPPGTPSIPHRRLNPLTGDWVLVSPQRATRPWLGHVEKTPAENLPAYDPTCYLCPGNPRAGGITNPHYTGTFVFNNDFPAILPATPAAGAIESIPLLVAELEQGICRVVCFSPRHDLTLPEMSLPQVETVLSTWVEQCADLGGRDFIHYVQVFENKGEMMGASNPHPHSQVWSSGHIPNEPAKEQARFSEHFLQAHHPLLVDYIEEENRRGERMLFSNQHFTAVVPFWAVWPFEVLVSAHRAGLTRLTELTPDELTALAEVFKEVTTRYDNLFEISFPYSMGFHQAPYDNQPHPEWTLHAHFYPPLLRSAMVRKFMVGYEMLAMPQRDITPEAAAERLRSVSDVHYKNKEKLEGHKGIS